ncbi:MAG: nucleotidyltransferase family protein, partial [Vallitaleaceae bacterium]|nr:nucleotidyltransferase family protein [Vallitaleaceae bacterium]
RALSALYPDSVDFLKGSNNILALEYLNALYELKSSIEPITIPRVGAAYLSNDIHESIPSASAIRTYLTACQENPLPLLQKAIPPTVYEHFEKDLIHGFYPLFPKDLYPVLCYLLQSTSEKEVEACYDFPLHLFRRLKQQLKNSHRYEDLIENSMSRNYTKTTVQRSLIHLLLHLSKEKADEAIRNHYHSYIRVLGFKKEAAHLLHKIKETSALPLVTNVKDRLPGLNSYAQEVLHNEIYYTNLYQQFVQNKYGVNLKDEYRRELVIL